jgi:hypothetical protein
MEEKKNTNPKQTTPDQTQQPSPSNPQSTETKGKTREKKRG